MLGSSGEALAFTQMGFPVSHEPRCAPTARAGSPHTQTRSLLEIRCKKTICSLLWQLQKLWGSRTGASKQQPVMGSRGAPCPALFVNAPAWLVRIPACPGARSRRQPEVQSKWEASWHLADSKKWEPFLTLSLMRKFNWLPVKLLNENKITAKNPEILEQIQVICSC